MMKLITHFLFFLGIFAFPLMAETMAPELLDLLNEDPSLLLDPGTQIAEPPNANPLPDSAREPASSPKTPEVKPEELSSSAADSEESDENEPEPELGELRVLFPLAAPNTEKKDGGDPVPVMAAPEISHSIELPEMQDDSETDPSLGELQVSFTITPNQPIEVAPEPVVAPLMAAPEISHSIELPETQDDSETDLPLGELHVAFTITPNQPIEVPPEPVVAPPVPAKLRSELEALPGVGDHAIILDGNQFFPATIKMKSGAKGRLLFITTSQKPAALVFVRPSIQRWVSSMEPPQQKKPIEEFREFSAEKIAQIPFEAEPGTYEFYDALSGAKGEIKVE